jgi:hypothetical protein
MQGVVVETKVRTLLEVRPVADIFPFKGVRIGRAIHENSLLSRGHPVAAGEAIEPEAKARAPSTHVQRH